MYGVMLKEHSTEVSNGTHESASPVDQAITLTSSLDFVDQCSDQMDDSLDFHIQDTFQMPIPFDNDFDHLSNPNLDQSLWSDIVFDDSLSNSNQFASASTSIVQNGNQDDTFNELNEFGDLNSALQPRDDETTSEEDDSDVSYDDFERNQFMLKLRNFSLEARVSRDIMSKLLKILREQGFHWFPSDYRTFLKMCSEVDGSSNQAPQFDPNAGIETILVCGNC